MNSIPGDNPRTSSLLTDRDLLRRFVQDSDETAFAEIVRRHHRLVMAVCRRVVGQAADAEDAFQATFLALARRPRSVRRCRSLPGWLYSVAFRTSCRLVRRRKQGAMAELSEQPPVTDPDPLDQIAEASEIAAVDEELNRLPEQYRDVLIMTYFSGQTSQQIADQLSESKGQVDGRLRQARNALRVRLARRGVEFGVMTVAASMSTASASAASPALIDATIQLGAYAVGQLPTPPDASVRLESLVRPEITVMSTKTMMTAGLLSLAVAALVGVGNLFPSAFGGGGGSGPVLQTEATPSEAGDGDTLPLIEVLQAAPQNAAVTDDANPRPVTARSRAARGAQYAGLSSVRKREAVARIRAALAEECPELDFPGDVPLSEVLTRIAESVNDTSGTRLIIVPDHRALELDGITSLDDITIRDLSLTGVSLHSALELIFAQTMDPELDYVLRDEVMLVTTEHGAEDEKYFATRIYDVSGILPLFHDPTSSAEDSVAAVTGSERFVLAQGSPGGPSDGFGSAAGADPNAMPVTPLFDPGRELTPGERLVLVIQDMTSPPAQWVDNGGAGGQISIAGTVLIVRQSRRGHEAVVDVLEQLEEIAAAQ